MFSLGICPHLKLDLVLSFAAGYWSLIITRDSTTRISHLSEEKESAETPTDKPPGDRKSAVEEPDVLEADPAGVTSRLIVGHREVRPDTVVSPQMAKSPLGTDQGSKVDWCSNHPSRTDGRLAPLHEAVKQIL